MQKITIKSSSSKFRFGGGLAIDNSNAKMVTDLIIENTFAKSGGALYVLGGELNINGAKIKDVSTTTGISSNSNDGSEEFQGYGGAIMLVKNAVLKADNTEILNARAKRGGAIFAQGGSDIQLNRSSLFSNKANLGGGAIKRR